MGTACLQNKCSYTIVEQLWLCTKQRCSMETDETAMEVSKSPDQR